MKIYAIFSHPENGRDFDQEEARKVLTPGEKYPLQNAFDRALQYKGTSEGHHGVFQLRALRFRG